MRKTLTGLLECKKVPPITRKIKMFIICVVTIPRGTILSQRIEGVEQVAGDSAKDARAWRQDSKGE